MTEVKMSIDEIKASYKELHTARARRYVSRKLEGIAEAYYGKFGQGYKGGRCLHGRSLFFAVFAGGFVIFFGMISLLT